MDAGTRRQWAGTWAPRFKVERPRGPWPGWATDQAETDGRARRTVPPVSLVDEAHARSQPMPSTASGPLCGKLAACLCGVHGGNMNWPGQSASRDGWGAAGDTLPAWSRSPLERAGGRVCCRGCADYREADRQGSWGALTAHAACPLATASGAAQGSLFPTCPRFIFP